MKYTKEKWTQNECSVIKKYIRFYRESKRKTLNHTLNRILRNISELWKVKMDIL